MIKIVAKIVFKFEANKTFLSKVKDIQGLVKKKGTENFNMTIILLMQVKELERSISKGILKAFNN